MMQPFLSQKKERIINQHVLTVRLVQIIENMKVILTKIKRSIQEYLDKIRSFLKKNITNNLKRSDTWTTHLIFFSVNDSVASRPFLNQENNHIYHITTVFIFRLYFGK